MCVTMLHALQFTPHAGHCTLSHTGHERSRSQSFPVRVTTLHAQSTCTRLHKRQYSLHARHERKCSLSCTEP